MENNITHVAFYCLSWRLQRFTGVIFHCQETPLAHLVVNTSAEARHNLS